MVHFVISQSVSDWVLVFILFEDAVGFRMTREEFGHYIFEKENTPSESEVTIFSTSCFQPFNITTLCNEVSQGISIIFNYCSKAK